MPNITRLNTVTIAVRDQDVALRWYTEVLGFEKQLDLQGEGFRWLTVAPREQKEIQILLASWFPDLVGKNAMWVLETPDCRAACEELRGRGVKIVEEPQEGRNRVEAVIEDLYGNRFELVETRVRPAA
jgi:catechol 2,3-dioxygenase-like lactoylglutathione lyase family enzyme